MSDNERDRARARLGIPRDVITYDVTPDTIPYTAVGFGIPSTEATWLEAVAAASEATDIDTVCARLAAMFAKGLASADNPYRTWAEQALRSFGTTLDHVMDEMTDEYADDDDHPPF